MEATTDPSVASGPAHGDVWTAPADLDPHDTAVVPVDPGSVVPTDGGVAPAVGMLGWDALDDTPLPPRRAKLVTPLTWALFGLLLVVGGFALGAKVGRDRAPKAAAAAFGAAGRANAGGATTTVVGNRAANGAASNGAGAPATGQAAAGQAAGSGAPGGGAPAGGGAGAPAGTGTGGAGAAGAGNAGGNGAGFAGAAAFGQVKLIDGNNVYVQDNQGNVIKVTTAAGVPVNVSKVGTVADLKPGDTIIVQGTADADGNVAATSITSAGAGAGFGGRGQRGGQGGQAGTGQNGGAQNGQNG